MDKGWSLGLHLVKFKVKEWRFVRDNIKDKDTSYNAHNSLIQDLWELW